MARVKFDQLGERRFKTGVDHGVLYPQKNGQYPLGVAWNGLTTVTKTPSGAEDNPQYADNIKYLNIKSAEQLGLTIECLTYPDEFKACNGEREVAPGVTIGQQSRNTFGFCYRTLLGNDLIGTDFGYELNLVYACSAAPSEQSSSTVNDSPEAAAFSYEVSTTPIVIEAKDEEGKPYKPTACLTIDSTKTDPDKLAALEDILYGTDSGDTGGDGTEPRLPLPDEVFELVANG